MNFDNPKYQIKKISIFTLPMFIFIFASQTLAYDLSGAKRLLPTVYKQYANTFYCDCEIKLGKNNSLAPQTKSCGYENRDPSQAKLATQGEFAHVISPQEFGKSRKCWKKGQREYCSENDALFRQMEGDLHNLVPTISEVNIDRLGLEFGIVEGDDHPYGKCNSKLDIEEKTFEPSEEIRGDIARTYLYFADHYSLELGKRQRKLFKKWTSSDPVDKNECELHDIKAALQGNPNRFIAKACAKADFSKESISSR